MPPDPVFIEALVDEPLPLPTDQPIAVHCAVGPRSMAGICVLRRRGFSNLLHVAGGFEAWQTAGFEQVRDD